MTILEAIRDRLPSLDATEQAPDAGSDPDALIPFDGYDRVEMSQLIQDLSDHTQIELDAVESYERAHKNREAVLDKLRYLRGPEPLPGYDALSADEILAALGDADLATVKRVRGYERKFAKRPDLLDEVVRTQRARKAAQPASAAPTYQSGSASAAVSARSE